MKKSKIRSVVSDVIVSIGLAIVVAGINLYSTGMAIIVGGLCVAGYGMILGLGDGQ